jgi:hypothetical protein
MLGFQIDNVENLNLNMLGDGDADGEDTTTISLVDGAQLTALTVTSVNTGLVTATGLAKGSDDLIITALETTLLNNLDASAMTGDFNMVDESAFVSTGCNNQRRIGCRYHYSWCRVLIRLLVVLVLTF